MTNNTEQPAVSEVTRQLIARDQAGRKKYGTTLDREDLTLIDWLQHMAEELLDGAGYALAAKRELGKSLEIERQTAICLAVSVIKANCTCICSINERLSFVPDSHFPDQETEDQVELAAKYLESLGLLVEDKRHPRNFLIRSEVVQ